MVKDPNQGGKKQIYGHWSHMRHVNTYYMTAVSVLKFVLEDVMRRAYVACHRYPFHRKF